MATTAKTAAVAEIRDAFRGSSAAVLTEYRGLTVAHLKELRRTLAGNATYAVVKNTLTKIAAADAGIDGFDALLEGPSAIAFVSGDPVTVAKVLRDFSKTNPLLVIKGGMLDGKPLSADEVRRLADLESRETLLARLAGAFQASLTGAISLFAAPLSQAARALGALQAAAEADPSVLPGGSGTPAESPIEQASTEEPVASGDAADAAEEPPAAPVDAQASTEEPPAESPIEQASTEEPVASGDAADAAVAADVLAREESSPAGDPAPEVTAPEMPAVQSLEEPPVESSEDPPT